MALRSGVPETPAVLMINLRYISRKSRILDDVPANCNGVSRGSPITENLWMPTDFTDPLYIVTLSERIGGSGNPDRKHAQSPRPGPSSAATGDFEKLLPADDAEIPHRVESIPFDSDADLFDRHVRLAVELNELATARFGSGQDRVSSHEPNAAENAVELHERVESLQRMAYRVYGQARSLRNELAVQRLADAELCFPLGADRLRALRDPGGDDGSRGAHQGPTSRRDCHDDGRIHGFWNRRRGTRYSERARHTWTRTQDGYFEHDGAKVATKFAGWTRSDQRARAAAAMGQARPTGYIEGLRRIDADVLTKNRPPPSPVLLT